MPHAKRNKSHELEVCGSKVKITISKNRTVVWYFLTRTRFLTKFGTKIDSYKMDVYETSGISNLTVVFKMATKMQKNLPCPDFSENWYAGQTWCDEFIYDLKYNHRTAFSERSRLTLPRFKQKLIYRANMMWRVHLWPQK